MKFYDINLIAISEVWLREHATSQIMQFLNMQNFIYNFGLCGIQILILLWRP